MRELLLNQYLTMLQKCMSKYFFNTFIFNKLLQTKNVLKFLHNMFVWIFTWQFESFLSILKDSSKQSWRFIPWPWESVCLYVRFSFVRSKPSLSEGVRNDRHSQLDNWIEDYMYTDSVCSPRARARAGLHCGEGTIPQSGNYTRMNYLLIYRTTI